MREGVWSRLPPKPTRSASGSFMGGSVMYDCVMAAAAEARVFGATRARRAAVPQPELHAAARGRGEGPRLGLLAAGAALRLERLDVLDDGLREGLGEGEGEGEG